MWGMVFIVYTTGGYRAGYKLDSFHITAIVASSMIFMMHIYDWYYSIQRLKLLTRCIEELDALCDSYLKRTSRD